MLLPGEQICLTQQRIQTIILLGQDKKPKPKRCTRNNPFTIINKFVHSCQTGRGCENMITVQHTAATSLCKQNPLTSGFVGRDADSVRACSLRCWTLTLLGTTPTTCSFYPVTPVMLWQHELCYNFHERFIVSPKSWICSSETSTAD